MGNTSPKPPSPPPNRGRGRGGMRGGMRPRLRRKADSLRSYGESPSIKEENYLDEPYKDLKVEDIDLLIEENSKDHHTDKYDLTESSAKLVLRRASSFSVKIRFSRKFILQDDTVRFAFTAGDYPQHGDGSLVHFSLTEMDPRGKWNAEMTEENENEIKVKIHIPPDCLVCKWQFKVEILEEKDGKTIVHLNKKIFPIDVYIIFNPWNEADTVYLEDEDLLQEYVLNDTGAIWVKNSSVYRPWSFGQFEKNILDCTMYLLDSSDTHESVKVRGNSVLVSRKLSAVGNVQDGGLLVGNWSGLYEGGTNPSKWQGSIKMMQQFWKTKSPIRYGQCWVFSGLLTTMCRALGIPCRSVTNFSSAHDTDGSTTIDRVFDIWGEKMSKDSVWNFHVWNEVWMRRPDIPKANYDGWQVIDCTPQEESQGIYQCGPIPVAAIKEGDISYNYDGAFIFAEVNADIVTWVVDRNGTLYLSDINRKHVGKDISTKAPGDAKEHKREDLTDTYKYKEGTDEEKGSVLSALHVSDPYEEEMYAAYNGFSGEKNVDVELDIPTRAKLGEDFVVKLTAMNRAKEEQSIYGSISCKPENYAGEALEGRKLEEVEGVLPPKGEDGRISLELKVTTDEYLKELHDGCYISVVGAVFNNTLKQATLVEKTFTLEKPVLKIDLPDEEIKVNQPFFATMSFTNPLDIPLTRCEIDIEGVGIETAPSTLSDVGPGKEFRTQVQLIATKTGFLRFGAAFNSAELFDISGGKYVFIS